MYIYINLSPIGIIIIYIRPNNPAPPLHTHTPVVNGPEKHILNRVDTRMRVALIMYLMKEFFL